MKQLARMITGGAMAVGVLATAVSAQASKIFSFDFSGSGVVASGEFVADSAGSPFALTGITGAINGDAITGLSGFASADNLVYSPGPPFVDTNGISFTTAHSGDFNLFNYFGTGDFSLSRQTDPSGSVFADAIPVALSVGTAVPEAATWALMLLGFGGVGAMLRQRRALGAAARA